MEIETVETIVNYMNQKPRAMIPAIRLLREFSGFGLIESKDYLEKHHSMRNLYNQLREDFVRNPEDLLLFAYAQRDALNAEIEKLESQVTQEKAQELIDILKDGAVTLVEALSSRKSKDWSEGPLFGGNLTDPRPVEFAGVSNNNVEY